MSDMKCPFCQDYLIPCIKNQNDWIYHCDNPKCPMYDDADIEDAKHPLASKDLWQELIRTKKQVEIYHEFVTKLYLNRNITVKSLLKLQKRLYIQNKGGNK